MATPETREDCALRRRRRVRDLLAAILPRPLVDGLTGGDGVRIGPTESRFSLLTSFADSPSSSPSPRLDPLFSFKRLKALQNLYIVRLDCDVSLPKMGEQEFECRALLLSLLISTGR